MLIIPARSLRIHQSLFTVTIVNAPCVHYYSLVSYFELVYMIPFSYYMYCFRIEFIQGGRYMRCYDRNELNYEMRRQE